MAEVMSKTNLNLNLLSSCHSTCSGRRRNNLHQSRARVSMFSNSSKSANNFPSVKRRTSSNLRSPPSDSEFWGRRVVGGAGGLKSIRLTRNNRSQAGGASNTQMNIGIGLGKSLKWWEKGLQPNMKEVTGAQDLVDFLLNAGDKLVVVDFFSPGCGGCKALHPKICQLAEMNPDVQFLQVNYEEHKSMCYSLNVHVLPFFRFYRGAHGRLCSFSCTNATIKKFKDALAKHKPDRCSLGPPKGLEEKELVALSANRDLAFTYDPKTEQPPAIPAQEEIAKEEAAVPVSHSIAEPNLPLPLPLQSAAGLSALQDTKDKNLVSPGR